MDAERSTRPGLELVVASATGVSVRATLVKQITTVGAAPSADVQVAAQKVARTKAQLQFAQYQQTLSDLQDLDYAQAISDFTRQQVALEAAQKSFVAISGLSLFKYI